MVVCSSASSSAPSLSGSAVAVVHFEFREIRLRFAAAAAGACVHLEADLVGKQQRFHLRTDLRQQALCPFQRGLSKKYRTETQAAANRLFQNAQALNGTVSAFREFCVSKSLAQLLDQRVVASLNAAKPVPRAESGFCELFHAKYSAIIRP